MELQVTSSGGKITDLFQHVQAYTIKDILKYNLLDFLLLKSYH